MNKKALTGILTLIMVITCSFTGFFIGKTFSGLESHGRYDVLDELSEVLNQYHYSDVDENDLLMGAANGMVSSLNDPYTFLFEYSANQSIGEEYIGIGISFSLIDGEFVVKDVIEGSPADLSGVRINDVLIKIGDTSLENKNFTDLGLLIKVNLGEENTLTFLRGSREYSVTLVSSVINAPSIKYRNIDGIGYIKIVEFSEKTANLFNQALKALENENITGLIIDVRDNPGGYLGSVVNILTNFMTGNSPYLRIENVKESDQELKNTYYYPLRDTVKKSYDIKVLINENSASAAEVFAVAMHYNGGYDLIGKTTYGKSVYQVDYEMQTLKNYYLHITLGNWYGPDNYSVKDQGIAPTKVVSKNSYMNLAQVILTDEKYELDVVSDDVKQIQLMLKCLGYDVRTDGYFDVDTLLVLNNKFSKSYIDAALADEIYELYKVEVKKDIHDALLQEALLELKWELM